MDRIIRRATLALSAAAMVAPQAVASQTRSAALDARHEGMATLARAIDASGGLERLRKLGSVRLQAEVTVYQVGQAPRPEEQSTRVGTSFYTLTRDLRTREWVLEGARSPDLQEPLVRFVRAKGDAFQHDLRNDVVREIPEGLDVESLADRLPYAPAALLEAWRRSETVRGLAPAQPGTASLTYADTAGLQVTLTFEGSGLLRTEEVVERHPQWGDVVRATTFEDYRAVDGLMFPFRMVTHVGPAPSHEAAVSGVTLDAALDRALLERPSNVPAEQPQGRPTVAGGAQKVEEIAPGIHQVLNVTPLYNVLLVRQEDRVFVIEAPGDAQAFALVRDSAASVLGGEEITDLVLTHHHFDHSSNLWRYLAAGTRVFAPAGSAPFVRAVAEAPRLASDAPSPEPDIELVRGRRLVGGGPNRFELIDAGPNPHAEEILIAYFPEHKLLWVPDVYGYLPGFTPPPLLLSFADRFEALDLDVEIIATAHTELSSVSEFREMVARARAASSERGGSDR